MAGIVAIVGRPNVGKSTLFNRILRDRRAIVEAEPGVTRDRHYAPAEWSGHHFVVIDTGGLEWEDDDPIQAHTTRQAEAAIDQADVLIFVVDARAGLTASDTAVADVLRRTDKPVVIAVNKVDDPDRDAEAAEFYALGLDAVIVAISAYHGTGTGDLLDEVVGRLPSVEPAGEPTPDEATQRIRVAVVGRPNVGKSSLVNAFLGEDRMIVADQPGTTRDAIDASFSHEGIEYVLVDTAGLRKRSRVKESVERYSILRTLRAIDRADVVLMVLDATESLAEQDKRVAGHVTEAGRAMVIVVNKWDAVEKDERTYLAYEEALRSGLHYADWASIVFASARTRRNLNRLLGAVRSAAEAHRRRIPTGDVTRAFRDAVAMNPPPSDGRRQLRVSYITQAKTAPPTFVFFVNSPDLVHGSYRRYLENYARKTWSLEGTPIRLLFRAKAGQ